MKRPTLIQGAYGTRGQYRTVEEIGYNETPVGCNWMRRKHQEVIEKGYDRSRILMWSMIRYEYYAV